MCLSFKGFLVPHQCTTRFTCIYRVTIINVLCDIDKIIKLCNIEKVVVDIERILPSDIPKYGLMDSSLSKSNLRMSVNAICLPFFLLLEVGKLINGFVDGRLSCGAFGRVGCNKDVDA